MLDGIPRPGRCYGTNGAGAGSNVQFSANGNTVNKTGAWITWSDIRIKQDVEDYRTGLAAISGLRPRRFCLIADVKNDADAPYHVGVVAQEAEDIIPEMIEREAHSRDGVDYDDF